jgi:hypothetical protein
MVARLHSIGVSRHAMDRSVVWINDVAKLSRDETKGKPIKSSAKEKAININEYHCALGLPSEATPRATAKLLVSG